MSSAIENYFEEEVEKIASVSKEQTIKKIIKIFDIPREVALKEYYKWKEQYLESSKCKPIVRKKIGERKEKIADIDKYIARNWGIMNSFVLANKLDISYKELKEKVCKLGLAPIGTVNFYHYSKEEDEKILELKNKLLSNMEIAKELGRTEGAICRRAHRLKRLEEQKNNI